MDTKELIAAILTLASCSMKPRSTSKQMGEADWRHVVKEYEQILSSLSNPMKPGQ